jgi:hypothetical protein
MSIQKYPRTPHIEGSREQPGDEDLDNIPFSQIANEYVVIEELVLMLMDNYCCKVADTI